MSSRFIENGSLEYPLAIIKTFVGKLNLPNEFNAEILVQVSQLRMNRNDYQSWTNCIGTFMNKMGAIAFFKVLPLELIHHDLNSFTYGKDSRSYLLPLISKNLNKDANLDFYVEYFLPMIMQIDTMKELEKKNQGSAIKIKKFETMLV